ncbi:MAG: sensor domain-containing diguanylate cyclase [Planctomycetota bacterium]
MVSLNSFDEAINEIYQSFDDLEKSERLVSFLRQQQEISRDAIRELKKQKHDLATIFEITNQLNAKSLDLSQLESFIRKMVMGQFLVSNVWILRQESFDKVELTLCAQRIKSQSETLSVHPDSELGKWLSVQQDPFWLHQPECASFEVLTHLRKAGAFLGLPLKKTDKNSNIELKGLILLSEKLTKQAFSEEELHFLKILAQMTAISLHNCQLYHCSIIDGLTRVYTRGYFDVHLAQEINRLRRYGSASVQANLRYVSLVMLDIDHFKCLNDTYGHPFGDVVLQNFAKVLRGSIRTVDCVSRYGGEEFAIIFPETNKTNTIFLADRLREAVEKQIFSDPRNGGQVKVTASFGLATYPDDAEDVRSLIRQADQALYRAKESGRNRVMTA